MSNWTVRKSKNRTLTISHHETKVGLLAFGSDVSQRFHKTLLPKKGFPMFTNTYSESDCADGYATIEFQNTYHLAYRDIPAIIKSHVRGNQALDFGCGAGRSTRFLSNLGFKTAGIDISPAMIAKAQEIDPDGTYMLVDNGDFSKFKTGQFDLVLSMFTFDNIQGFEHKVNIFREMRRVIKDSGRIISLVSTVDMYTNEWASFTTKDYPENKQAKCGDIVRIINTDSSFPEPVEDVLWPDEDYRKVYGCAELEVEEFYKPLGRENEPFEWVNETRIAPWAIYVLGKG